MQIPTIAFSLLLTSCASPLTELLFQKHSASDSTVWQGNHELHSRLVSFETDEGTNLNIDVSPDGMTLIFDMLGDVYSLPIFGGRAMPLTIGRAWDSAPKFSLDGKFIFFISDRGGISNIWRLNLASNSLSQVTKSKTNIVGSLNWSEDGARLLAARSYSDNTEYILQSIDPKTGETTPVDAPETSLFDLASGQFNRWHIRRFSAVKTAKGKLYYGERQYDEERAALAVAIHEFDFATGLKNRLTSSDASYSEYKPQLSHDGARLSYFRQYQDGKTEIRILNLLTGQDALVVVINAAEDPDYGASHDARPNYTFTPSDDEIVFWHGGKIYEVNIASGSMRAIPFKVMVVREVLEQANVNRKRDNQAGIAKIIRWPSISSDGHTMAFASIGYVWMNDLASRRIRRLTLENEFAYMPAISPDGKSVAYISFAESRDEDWSGSLVVIDIDSGKRRQVLTAPNVTFLLPRWSNDSQKIALIRESKTDVGVQSSFGWVSLYSNKFIEVARAPAANALFNATIYARFVGFDDVGENLLFSYQRSDNQMALSAVALDGSNKRLLAIGDAGVVGIAPSPNLANLVLTRSDETLWLVPFKAEVKTVRVSAHVSEAQRIGDSAGYYVTWNGPRNIIFGFGQKVFVYNTESQALKTSSLQVSYATDAVAFPIAFRGVRLLTVSTKHGVGPVIESGTVVIDGERITAVGPTEKITIPTAAIVLDLEGKTILPGFLDTHYHRIGGGSGGSNAASSSFKFPNQDFGDPSALAYGVTTAWEPGGIKNDGGPAIADFQAAGRIAGPRWSYAAQGIVGSAWEEVTSFDTARAVVKRFKMLGVDVIKEGFAPSRNQHVWVASAAREEGMGIVSHIDNFEDLVVGIADGYTGGDHSYFPMPFYHDVAEMLRQSGYIWTPNIVITSGTIGSTKDKVGYYWRDVLKRFPNELEKLNAISHYELEIGEYSVPYEKHRVSVVAKAAATLATNGGNIGVSAHDMPGAGLHREMWYLWKGGMPIEDVLRAATIGNAEKLGLQEEVGSLEVGKMADLLILDENPLNDIINTLSLKYTVQGGVIYESDTAERIDPQTLGSRVH